MILAGENFLGLCDIFLANFCGYRNSKRRDDVSEGMRLSDDALASFLSAEAVTAMENAGR